MLRPPGELALALAARRPGRGGHRPTAGSAPGEGWRVTGYVDVENVVAADPLLDLAKTDYFALRHSESKRRAFIRSYGLLPRGWVPRVDLYRLHHALEFWNWSASAGKWDVLADIRTDFEEIVSNDAAQ